MRNGRVTKKFDGFGNRDESYETSPQKDHLLESLLMQSVNLDPVIKELATQLSDTSMSAKERIENFGQTLEYLVENKKILQYAKTPELLQSLIELVIKHNQNLGSVVSWM